MLSIPSKYGAHMNIYFFFKKFHLSTPYLTGQKDIKCKIFSKFERDGKILPFRFGVFLYVQIWRNIKNLIYTPYLDGIVLYRSKWSFCVAFSCVR